MEYRCWFINKDNEWTKGFSHKFEIEPVIGARFTKSFHGITHCYKVNAVHPDKDIVYTSFIGYPCQAV